MPTPALANADGSQPRVRLAGPDAQPPEIRGWVDLGDSVAIAAGNEKNASWCINRHFCKPEYHLRVVIGGDGTDPDASEQIGSITKVAFVQWEDDTSNYRRLVPNTTAKEFIALYVKTDRGRALVKEMAQAHSVVEAALAPAGSFEQRAALTGAEDSAVAAQAVPVLGMAPAPAAANNHHVVSSRGDVNIHVGTPAAAPVALSDDGQASGKELQVVPSNQLIELAAQPDNPELQAFGMRMLARVERSAEAQARKQEVETEIVVSRKRHLDHMAELGELKESVAMLRENGGMTPAASRALARRVLGTGELSTEIRSSDDHALERVVQQAASLRTAKEHQELLTATPVTDRKKLNKLRTDVKRAYRATMGDWPHPAWRTKERTMEVDRYPTDWLEGQRGLFARLA